MSEFLEPIDREIQLRLFQKMRILGREGNSPNSTLTIGGQDGLSLDKLATRSTFIRMTSGLNEPVILMGGELVNGSDTAAGYDEIYGPRPYFSQDDLLKLNPVGENKFRRPMPGIKSLDAQFLGGNKALRQATVNWTCWSFDDIDRLTPHFLSVGKTVCVEWGWVYGNKGLQNVRGFIGPSGIRKSAYQNNRKVIQNAKGDIDMVVGIVKNFEFNTRSDGGFDCTTTLSSIGVDFLKKPTPAKGATNMTVRLGVKKGETADDLKKKTESDNENITPSDVTLKNVVFLLNGYLYEQVRRPGSKITADRAREGVKDVGNYIWVEDSFIIQKNGKKTKNNVWVRWGWFEDNILSKFETVIGGKGIEKSQIRSVNYVDDFLGDRYEPTLIKDHEEFQTVNPFKYILPGKFFTLSSSDFANVFTAEEQERADLKALLKNLKGDDAKLTELAGIVNDLNNFSPFNSQDYDFATIPDTILSKPRADRGVFRNMLIHTDVIKEAFGVKEGFGAESLSTYEALSRMFGILNEDIGFWNFQLQPDRVQSHRIRVVDGFATEKPIPSKPSKPLLNQPLNRSIYNKAENRVDNNGVFFFPVWQHDSIVKDQNVSCTIPNSVAISVMYGANAPKIDTQGAVENEANDEGAQGAGGMGKSQNDGGDLENLQIVFHNPNIEKYGVDSELEYDRGGLRNKGDNLQISLKDYFTDEKTRDLVDKRSKEIKEEKDKEINAASAGRLNTFLDEDINNSLPPPLLSSLEPDVRKKLLRDIVAGDKKLKPEKFGGLSDFQQLYSAKFDDNGRMKQEFIDSIVYNTTYSTRTVKTKTSELDKPLLLPIEIELSIDGIGGILPFQSFHSTYLPKRYQDEALFQIFSVNHTVDSSQWTTTIGGKMRTTFKNIYKTEIQEVEKADVLEQFNKAQKASTATELKKKINKEVEDANKAWNNKKGKQTTVQEKVNQLADQIKAEQEAEKNE